MQVIRSNNKPFVPASHEDPRHPGVLKRVLATRDELLDGRVQMINWARLPAGSSFRAHYHQDMEEVFIILSGRVCVTVDGKEEELSAGDAIVISPNEVHQMKNTTRSDIEYLVVGISLGQGGQTVVVAEA